MHKNSCPQRVTDKNHNPSNEKLFKAALTSGWRALVLFRDPPNAPRRPACSQPRHQKKPPLSLRKNKPLRKSQTLTHSKKETPAATHPERKHRNTKPPKPIRPGSSTAKPTWKERPAASLSTVHSCSLGLRTHMPQ